MKTGGILVGIEHEFFLFHANGEAPSYDTADAVFQRLFELLGGEFIASSTGHIYGLEYQTEFGSLSLKHEASTHILEIAFPPVQNPAAFCCLYDGVFFALNEAISLVGLHVVAGGMIAQLPRLSFPSVARDDLPRIKRRNIWRDLQDTGDPLFVVDFPATICSTQVNLSVPDGVLIPRLARYYAMEYLTPLLFSTSEIRRPIVAHCARLLRYDACMPGAFRIIPEQISPATETYTLGMRDYSAIVPKGAFVEFRAGCSQHSSSRILDLAVLKLLQHVFAMRDFPITPRSPAKLFKEVCRTGSPPEEFFEDIEILETCLSDLPHEWRECAEGFLKFRQEFRPRKA